MGKLRYYEDVTVGDEIAPLIKQPTTRQLVMWAGASGDYNEIHYDKDFAQSRGLSGVIVPGQMVCSFLGQLMTDWIGEEGNLKKLTCSYKSMNYPGETLACKGEVKKKYTEGEEHLVECNLWVENEKGERTISSRATIVLPSRE